MTRKFNTLLLGLLIVVGLPFYWLLLDATTPGNETKPVTIAQLRELAGSVPGAAPVAVRYERVARRTVMSNLLAAGSGLRPGPYMVRAFELVLPGGEIITIDRGVSRAVAEREDLGNFDPGAQSVAESVQERAKLALTLDPRPQHTGKLNAGAGFGSGLPEGMPAAGPAPYAVSPGVVVIPAYTVNPGARMVYVRFASGREMLFAGDIAPVQIAWQQTRPPARIVTSYLRPRNREEIGAWLRTIKALKQTAPALQIVAGHDAALPRMIRKGFAAPSAAKPLKGSQAAGVGAAHAIKAAANAPDERQRRDGLS